MGVLGPGFLTLAREQADQDIANRETRLRDTLAAALNETAGPAFQRDFLDLEAAVEHAAAAIRGAYGEIALIKGILPKNDPHERLSTRARRHVREAQARERGAKLVEGALIYWQEINARGAEDYDTADVLADLREIAAALAVADPCMRTPGGNMKPKETRFTKRNSKSWLVEGPGGAGLVVSLHVKSGVAGLRPLDPEVGPGFALSREAVQRLIELLVFLVPPPGFSLAVAAEE